jgi:hypothetical protein
MTGGYPVALARYSGQGEVKDLVKSGAWQHVPRAAPLRACMGHLMGFAVMSRGAGLVGRHGQDGGRTAASARVIVICQPGVPPTSRCGPGPVPDESSL